MRRSLLAFVAALAILAISGSATMASTTGTWQGGTIEDTNPSQVTVFMPMHFHSDSGYAAFSLSDGLQGGTALGWFDKNWSQVTKYRGTTWGAGSTGYKNFYTPSGSVYVPSVYFYLAATDLNDCKGLFGWFPTCSDNYFNGYLYY
jgi:hypothetical protein